MPAHHVLVVAVDGLRASALGAYGNTSFPTPALDQFAAESFLLDWCYAPAPELDAVYRALWQSVHPARGTSPRGTTASLPRVFADRNFSTTLITDEAELVSIAPAADFEQCIRLADAARTRAEDTSQTALARLLAAACDVIAAPGDSPRLVWVHARGMYGPWDAPLELQRSLLDEGDPPPVESVAPPDFYLADRDDPDAAFRYGCAYAAQAMVLDACWKGVLEAIQSVGGEWLVMLLGVRGFPLGEHRRVGGVDPRLYAEQLHVPWLVKFPDGRGCLARSGQLVSHVDLLPTLADWIGGGAPEETTGCDGMSILPLVSMAVTTWRDALVSTSGTGHRAIRTAEWCLRQDAAGSEQRELYVRPDDRWESNDVAKLCPDEIETLARKLDDALVSGVGSQVSEPDA